MKNTRLNLTQAGANKVLEALEAVPHNKRDNAWILVHSDVKKIIEIWNNIDVRKDHMVKIARQAKTSLGTKVRSPK